MAINFNHQTETISATADEVAILETNFSFKNRLINGQFLISQRGVAAQTVTAGNTVPTVSTGYYIDRWFTYSLGANVTINPVVFSGSVTAQITGAAGVTEIGVGQRIESINSKDLAGSAATLFFAAANTLLSNITVSLSYATTTDTFGTIAAPTKTEFASVTYTSVSSTLKFYSVVLTVPAAATTGIEILFKVGAQTSGNLYLGLVQFEKGSSFSSYDYRPLGLDFLLCRRYLEGVSSTVYRKSGYHTTAGATTNYGSFPMNVAKRITPTITSSTGGAPGWGASNASSISYALSNNTFSFNVTNTAAGFWNIFNNATIMINAEL